MKKMKLIFHLNCGLFLAKTQESDKKKQSYIIYFIDNKKNMQKNTLSAKEMMQRKTFLMKIHITVLFLKHFMVINVVMIILICCGGGLGEIIEIE
jgi:hypothetical protein